MFKSDRERDEQLDRAGRILLRAAAADEAEIEAAASPFLFTRVRAAIAEQRSRPDAGGWLSIFMVARRAVPAMALVALLTAVLTVWSVLGTPNATSDDDALFDIPGPGVEQAVLTDKNGLPPDEVLNIVVDRNYERGAK